LNLSLPRESRERGAALLRFHLHVGSRLALRALMPTVAAGVGGLFFLGDDFFVSFARLLFGSGSTGGAGVLIALAAAAFASVAAPRVCRGLGGWMRHLPIHGRAQRQAALVAIAVAQTPLLLALAVFAWVATDFGKHLGAFLVDLLALAVCAPAATLVVLPVERPLLTRPLALAAALLAVSGGGMQLAAGLLLLLAADRVAGELPRHATAGTPISVRGRLGVSDGFLDRFVELRIAWRALKWRLLSSWVAGFLPLGAALLFVTNNPLAPQHVRLAGLLGGASAVVFLFADLGEALGVRRPAWPWVRSLPWSADRRVRADAALLAAHALPLLVVTAKIDLLAAVAVLAVTPWLAARAAGAVRRAPERRTGASGEILIEGFLLAAAVALLPWLALLALAGTPWALRVAAERERAQKVSRWLELHHLAVGDPQSWSAG
jgi:hypothetical protein